MVLQAFSEPVRVPWGMSRAGSHAGHAAAAKSMTLRMLTLPPHAAAPGVTAAPAAVEPVQRSRPVAEAPRDATPDPLPKQAQEAPVLIAQAPVQDGADRLMTTQGTAELPTQDVYLPRPQLTIAPTLTSPVLLNAPEGDTEIARHVGVLALFIDQSGRVHHIQAEEPRLPPAFERIAREAFMAATFTPGQLDGQEVKSRIRIEVVFDNTPLTGP
jgi:hypothetical protein